MLAWLLALQTRFLGDWALPVTAGVVNTASVMWTVALARRRGGRWLMFVTAIALGAMFASLPSETWHDILNPSIALLPFTLVLFLAWGVGCGEYRLLPVTVLVASFVCQAHFTMTIPTMGVLVVALGALAVAVRRGAGSTDVHRNRWLAASAGIAIACWIGPLVDQAVHRPGNVARVVQVALAGQDSFGVEAGWHSLVRAVGVPPWWLRLPRESSGRFLDIAVAPSTASILTCGLLLGGLVLCGAAGARRRRADVAVAALFALVLCAAIVVGIGSIPTRLVLSVDKAARWTSPGGMFVWLVAGWALSTLLGPARWRPARWLRTPAAAGRAPPAWLVGLSITAVVGIAVSTRQEADAWEATYRPARALGDRLVATLPLDRAVSVQRYGGGGAALAVQTAIIYRLRKEGYDVVTTSSPAQAMVAKLGAAYGRERHHADEVVLVDELDTRERPKGSHVLWREPLTPTRDRDGPPKTRRITVSIVPAAMVP
jgi:hypothetical protein